MAADDGSFQTLTPAGDGAAGPGPRAGRGRFGGSTLESELPSLEPRGVGAILDTGIDVLRERFLVCVLMIAPLWLVPSALQHLGRESQTVGDLAATLGGLALMFCVQSIGIGLVTSVVYAQMQGRPVRASTAIATGLRRTPALLLLALLSQPPIALGLMCCMAPGILLMWLWSVAPAALVLEQLGPIGALRRSVALVRGSFWRWAGLAAIQTALVLPLSSITGVLSLVEVEQWLRPRLGLTPVTYGVLDVLLASALSGLLTAVTAVFMTVFYLDLRVRAEGFDLEMRFERLRARARERSGVDPAAARS